MKTGDKVRVMKWEDAIKTKWYNGLTVNYIHESCWPVAGIIIDKNTALKDKMWKVRIDNITSWIIPEELLEVIE